MTCCDAQTYCGRRSRRSGRVIFIAFVSYPTELSRRHLHEAAPASDGCFILAI